MQPVNVSFLQMSTFWCKGAFVETFFLLLWEAPVSIRFQEQADKKNPSGRPYFTLSALQAGRTSLNFDTRDY